MNTYSPSAPSGGVTSWFSRGVAWLDARGKLAWIAAMVLGFIFVWPVGLAITGLLVIVPGMVVMAIYGLPLAVDFKGGSLLEVQFSTETIPTVEQVVEIYNQYGFEEVSVQTAEGTTGIRNILVIRSPDLATTIDGKEVNADAMKNILVADLREVANDPNAEVNTFSNVGPSIAQQVTQRAGLAVALAALAVVIYIYFVFRGIPHSLRYGICAVLAMLHDILVVLSLTAIGGRLFGWQVDSLFLTALLTVIGFSTQDKIVVFDRIRENIRLRKIYLDPNDRKRFSRATVDA